MAKIDEYNCRKTAVIPKWAAGVRLYSNNIDGWAPDVMGQDWSVDKFLANAEALQLRDGGGEWVVLAYAIEHLDGESGQRAPYGKDNPYRTLRSVPGNRLKKIAEWDYMRWTFWDFVKEKQ